MKTFNIKQKMHMNEDDFIGNNDEHDYQLKAYDVTP